MVKEKLNSNGNIAFNGEEAKLFSNFVMKIVEQEQLRSYCLILYFHTGGSSHVMFLPLSKIDDFK